MSTGPAGSAAPAAGDSRAAAGAGREQQAAGDSGGPAAGGNGVQGQQEQQQQEPFRILSEEPMHRRYITMYNRRVQFPEGQVLDFDVAGHPQCDFHYAVVFPFHPADGTVTLIREYAQGVNSMMWCLPTGGFDPRRHASYEACARAELSEEARLAGGTWEPLVPLDHPGIPELKWCRNRFHAWLVTDPQPDAAPGARDAEELTIQVARVSLARLREIMLSGDMMLPSVTTAFLALDRLQQRQQQAAQQQAQPAQRPEQP